MTDKLSSVISVPPISILHLHLLNISEPDCDMTSNRQWAMPEARPRVVTKTQEESSAKKRRDAVEGGIQGQGDSVWGDACYILVQ